MIAAAANDGSGTVGIAYDATIMAVRSDTPGTCASVDGCSFGDVADAIQWAVDHGATVINMSLGGALATTAEENAVIAAANAGIVVVISSGNDGATRPDPFPRSLAALGLGNVIIVGSVDGSGNASSFSNGARNSADFYISALGEDVTVVLPEGTFLISGTSFSAPQVSGAVALIAQAFPTLTATQIVDLLFSTAQDVGAAGIDNVYGHGILDIHEAFQPQGMTTLAGEILPGFTPLTTTGFAASPAMGDALSTASVETVVLDKYSRAFAYNLAGSMRGASVSQRLISALGGETRFLGGGSGKASMAFTIDASGKGARLTSIDQLQLDYGDAERARVLAARMALTIAPGSQLGFAYREGANGLVAQLQGRDRPAFLVARPADNDDGIYRRSDLTLAFRQRLGPWGLTLSAEQGRAITGLDFDRSRAGLVGLREDPVRSFGLALDRHIGALETQLGLSWLQENSTILGARFNDSFGQGGANSLFLDTSAGLQLSQRWRLGASVRQGWTNAASGGLITDGSQLYSMGWSLDLERAGIFGKRDRLGLRLAQPMRVESGGINLHLPISYSYSTLETVYGTRRLALSPTGRELMAELAWHGPLAGGTGWMSLYYRREPGHYSYAPDDTGVAIRWSGEF